MGLRLVSRLQTTNVVKRQPASTLEPQIEEYSPEPRQLYHLIVLALLLHQPTTDWMCPCCDLPWPCEQVRLAYRLREGF